MGESAMQITHSLVPHAMNTSIAHQRNQATQALSDRSQEYRQIPGEQVIEGQLLKRRSANDRRTNTSIDWSRRITDNFKRATSAQTSSNNAIDIYTDIARLDRLRVVAGIDIYV